MAKYPYQNSFDSLLYLAVGTIPDNYLSQFNTGYGNEHWMAAKRVLRYLKGPIEKYRIIYNKTGINLERYEDVDWGACIYDGRS